MNSFILWTVFLSSYSYAVRDAQYECGPHGRFEYCIDDIPGCIVGCHCHPGYYFDTDTKICEPNIKLTQDFRRHYLSQPERTQYSEATPLPATTAPTPTTINTIDNKIDEITNDADELGDWLYNQFFKTIENQVINKTKDDEHPLTRRSDSNPIKKKPKRKPRTFYKRASKKKKSKSKKHGLKRKLLRITEDDSLFDSASSSSSGESSSSSSSESGSDTSSDGGRSDKDHGHKKILIYNKKPKPSLPSFIFLPNIDTPYYPPLGLPPPPAVPMYPMVPVPPVASIYSLTGLVTPNCDDDLTKGATATATSFNGQSSIADANSISDAPSGITSPVESTATTTTTTTAATPTTTMTSSDASHLPNEQGNTPEEGGDNNNTTPKSTKRRGGHSNQEKKLWANLKQGQRNKFLQKLRERMKDRNMISQLSPINQYQDLHAPFIDDNMAAETLPYAQKPEPNEIEDNVPVEDVDFKYLTQLIHKANLNNTHNKPLRNLKDRIETIPPIGRRNFENSYYANINEPETSYAQRTGRRRFSPSQNEPEDAYYTNLGRQIASMIRKIETNIGNREVDIEIENTNQRPLNHPIFSENTYSPRNYWERYVRSPIKKYFPTDFNDFEYLKKNNEDLFSLENKVEIAASTVPSMSLHELENIVNIMENVQAKKQKQNNLKFTKESNTNLNINLLQKSETVQKHDSKMIKINYELENKNDNNRQSHNSHPDIHKMNGFLNFKPLFETQTKKIEVLNSVPYDITRKRIPDMINRSALNFPVLTGKLPFIRNVKKPLTTKVTTKPSYVFQFDSMVHQNQNRNYYTKNNNQYIYEKASFPYLPLYLSSNKPAKLPVKSYFHHELHHFDYFDK